MVTSNSVFIARMEKHREERLLAEKERLEEIKKEEILERHKLSGVAYIRKNSEQQAQIRAVAYTHKLTRWVK